MRRTQAKKIAPKRPATRPRALVDVAAHGAAAVSILAALISAAYNFLRIWESPTIRRALSKARAKKSRKRAPRA